MARRKAPRVAVESLETLQDDRRNANKGTPRGDGMLERSLRQLGAGRSILVDREGRIIAGNKTRQKAVEIGFKDAIVVDTDGRQLVVVRRTDLDLDDPSSPARRLAFADNRVGQVDLDWDRDVIDAEIQEGFDLSDLFTDHELQAILAQQDEEPPGPAPEKDKPEITYCCPRCHHEWTE